jgi:hypothetical protein
MLFSKVNPPDGFYVYAYLREDGTPYYVGKGKDKRAWVKGKDEVQPPVDKNNISIIAYSLEEQDALIMEAMLISSYGRKNNGTGILRNKTDGGETFLGAVRTDEWNDKIGASLRGKPKSNKHKQRLSLSRKGNKYPKLSTAKKGIPQTTESNLKRSATMTGVARPQPLLCCIRCHREVGLNGFTKHLNSKRCVDLI